MKKIVINGGKKLHGTLNIDGMKNAALPIIFATVLVNGDCYIENVPNIDDVCVCLEIIKEMGADVEWLSDNEVRINTGNIVPQTVSYDLCKKIRASYYLMGVELGRYGVTKIGYPGGCNLGKSRPMEQHIKGFKALGAEIQENAFDISGTAPDGKLHASKINFDFTTVGGTINIILASVLTPGITVIENAAREPHIVDLANFLNTCGANIKGAGSETIKITGVDSLHGCSYTIIPDMIVAGTYMVAAAITGGVVKLENVIPKHLESVSAKLSEIGVVVEEDGDSIIVDANNKKLSPVTINTQPYPGFPTDMQAQFGALLSVVPGESKIIENIYQKRFKYTDELSRMGAVIEVGEKSATFNGVPKLHGASVRATDLRAGGAIVIAALAAQGTTEIDDIHIIERGYDNIVGNLSSIGADISIIDD